ncbi:hypothetical protein JY409_11910, partial [Stenotrophomonas maltophilia]|nr:hypothetical protein [Stenotrophomonas maltophilia]
MAHVPPLPLRSPGMARRYRIPRPIVAPPGMARRYRIPRPIAALAGPGPAPVAYKQLPLPP